VTPGVQFAANKFSILGTGGLPFQKVDWMATTLERLKIQIGTLLNEHSSAVTTNGTR
jgi:hypothetical protein